MLGKSTTPPELQPHLVLELLNIVAMVLNEWVHWTVPCSHHIVGVFSL